MPASNCYCFKCKQSLIEIIESRDLILTGCVNCNIWWAADSGPVRPDMSQEKLRLLNQTPIGTPDQIAS